ncbi:MAG TPA: hypothetical protein VH722_07330 [Alphaproteobacteria bacterium]|jgi:hypothetical protein|nr:hypothetical protein [Alphaproteobacteria bacterium]
MTKLLWALVALSSSAAAHAQDFSPFVGGGPAFREFKAMVEGRQVTVVQITAYFHQMNLPPRSVQPIGLEEFRFFIKDAQGNTDRCEKWIKKSRPTKLPGAGPNRHSPISRSTSPMAPSRSLSAAPPPITAMPRAAGKQWISERHYIKRPNY